MTDLNGSNFKENRVKVQRFRGRRLWLGRMLTSTRSLVAVGSVAAVFAATLAVVPLGAVTATQAAAPRTLSHTALTSSITSWGTQESSPAFDNVSCAPTTGVAAPLCVAVGATPSDAGLAAVSTDNGLEWNQVDMPSGVGKLSVVSCPTATVCQATDGPHIVDTTNAGATWSEETLPSGSWGIDAMSCVNADDCVVIAMTGSTDTVLVTSNGGSSWSTESLPSNSYLGAVSCSTTSDCVATGTYSSQAGVWYSANNGSTWSEGTLPYIFSITGTVSCPTSSDCYIGGSQQQGNYNIPGDVWYSPVVMATTDGGAEWSDVSPPTDESTLQGYVENLSCPTTTICYGVGVNRTATSNALILVTTNGGSSWSASAGAADGTGSLSNDVSCANVSVCAMVGATGIQLTTNGGSLWATAYYTLPDMSAVSCPSATDCEAVGGRSAGGFVAGTATAGASWLPQTMQSASLYEYSVSCANTSDCLMGGTPNTSGQIESGATVEATTTGGVPSSSGSTGWSAQTVPTNAYSIGALSCPDTQHCFATSGQIWSSGGLAGVNPAVMSTSNGGSTWSLTELSARIILSGISCSTDLVCVTTGSGYNEVYYTNDGGTTWTQSSLPSGMTGFNAVSCVSSTTCFANGYEGSGSAFVESTNGGETWSVEQSVDDGVDSMSCVINGGAPACVALGGTDIWTTTNGSTWSGQTSLTGVSLTSVSCADASDCWAVGTNVGGGGVVLSTNGVIGPADGAIDVAEMFGGSDPSAPCLACFLASKGLAAQAFVGDPVDTATGDFSESLPLVDVKGDGAGLSFTATYDAQLSQQQVSSGGSAGPLGWGWSSNFGMSLSIASGSGDSTIHQENGSQDTYDPSSTGPGGCTTSSSVQCYTAQASQVTASLRKNLSTGQFTFTRSGSLDTFLFGPASGGISTLVSESTSNGYVDSYSYGVSPGSGGCPSVTGVVSCTVESDPAGRHLAVGYSAASSAGSIVMVQDPSGNQWNFAYDGSGNLTSVTDPLSRVTSFGYTTSNSNPNLVHDMNSVVDPNEQSGGADSGHSLTLGYDPQGRVDTQTDGAGLTTTFSYDGDNMSSSGGTTTITGPQGQVTEDIYVSGALLATITGVDTATPQATVYGRNSTSLLPTEVIDPGGNVTRYLYDSQGNITSETTPVNVADGGPATTTTYNSFNEPLVRTAPDGLTTTDSYDSAGNIQSSVVSGSGVTGSDSSGCPSGYCSLTTDYYYTDSSHPGDVTKVVDPAGNETDYTYNSYGNVATSTTNPSGSVTDETKNSYTTLGQLYCSVSPNETALSVSCPSYGGTYVSGTSVAAFDADGEVTSSTDAAGATNSYGYDADGNKTYSIDPLSRITYNVYDANDRLTESVAGFYSSTPLTTTYAYDVAPGSGSCTSAPTGTVFCDATTAPAGTTVTYLNALGETLETNAPGGVTTSFTYFPTGKVQTSTTAGGAEAYLYDANGNELSETSSAHNAGFSATPTITYTYDVDARRSQMTDGSGTTNYKYDALERTSSVDESLTGGGTSDLSYGYNKDGQQTSLTYPGGQSIAKAYDGAGEMASESDFQARTTSYTYDHDRNLTVTTSPNGTQVTNAYNVDNAMSSYALEQQSAPTTTVQGGYYGRDSTNLTTYEVGVTNGTWTGYVSYGYNYAGQLSTVDANAQGYDSAQNPSTLNVPGTTGTSTSVSQSFNSSDQVTASSGSGMTAAYAYDSLGDRTSITPQVGPAASYSYQQSGQLSGNTPSATSSSVSSGGDFSLALDGQGNVWSWGTNGDGQLGNNSTTNSDTPVEITGLSNVVAISAGWQTGYAVEANGTLWAWGSNADDELGTTSPSYSDVPVQVSGVSNVVSVSAGYQGAMALEASGTAYVWGSNYDGQLGNGSTSGTDTATPTAVSGLSGVTQISAGGYHDMAVTSSGQLYGWGYDSTGQVGNGGTSNVLTPTAITISGGTKAVSAGGYHTLALSNSGAVYAFGSNTDGQLGLGNTTAVSSPTVISSVTASAVSAGQNESLITTTSGAVLATGNITYGTNTPGTGVLLTLSGVTSPNSISVGGYDAFVASGSSVEGFGSGANGQLGDGSTSDSTSLVTASPLNLEVTPVTEAYTYNGGGLRTAKTYTVGGTNVTEAFRWDTTTSVPQLLQDASTSVTTSYIYGPTGAVIEQEDNTSGGNPLFYLTDDQDSTRGLVSLAGSVVGTYAYSPDGAVVSKTGSIGTPIQFQGAYADRETGFLYLQNRYLDPSTGVFLTVDPLVAMTGQAYEYAGDNPVNNTDPTGLYWGEGLVHQALNIVAVPVYGVYYGAYETGRGINAVGCSLGSIACGLTHGAVALTPIPAAEAAGLGGDAGLDWLKNKTTDNGESIYDEDINGSVLPRGLGGPTTWLPGLSKNRCGSIHIDFEW